MPLFISTIFSFNLHIFDSDLFIVHWEMHIWLLWNSHSAWYIHLNSIRFALHTQKKPTETMSFDYLHLFAVFISFRHIFEFAFFDVYTKTAKLYHVRDLLVSICATKRNPHKMHYIHKSIIKSTHATQLLDFDIFDTIRLSGGKSLINDKTPTKI